LILWRQRAEQWLREVSGDKIVFNRIVYFGELLVDPSALVGTQIRNSQLGPPFRSSQYVQTCVGGDSRQPTFHRSASFKTPELRERFQKDFLRRIFHLTAFAKEPACNTENSRTESFDYFSEGRLIAILRLSRQVEFGGLFNPTLQMRSSSEDGGSLVVDHLPFVIFH
jgi:hypothetical protein